MASSLQLARWLPALALGSAIALGAGAARAAITVTYNKRSISTRDKDQKPLWVNHKDCVDQNNLDFTLGLPAGSLAYQLEVWAALSGTDCTDPTQRNVNGSCWQVYIATPTTTTWPVEVAARDIAGQHKPGTSAGSSGPGSGTLEDCDGNQFSDQGASITLYFMLVQGTGAQPYLSANYTGTGASTLGVDLIGPPAATNVSAGAGDNELIMSWTPPQGSPVNGYRFYCFPTPGSTGDAAAPLGSAGADGGIAGATGAGGGAGMSGMAGASGTGGTAGGGGTAGASGGGGTAGATDAGSKTDSGSDAGPDCLGSPLVPGKLPDETYYCGSGTGNTATSGAVKGLENGTTYAVGVALTDTVNNIGLLSVAECGTPKQVNGFFDQYRNAGGQAGGGFCAIARKPAPGAGLAFALALVATMLRRRRRAR